ncbi:hypothetical protein NZA98_03240, partial [Escherichia coli]|nr:hypothetical protein [Escherichia coli]
QDAGQFSAKRCKIVVYVLAGSGGDFTAKTNKNTMAYHERDFHWLLAARLCGEATRPGIILDQSTRILTGLPKIASAISASHANFSGRT